VLVEGYMDVIAMHQAGVKNTVAPLGTALTEQQARLLKRYCGRVVCIFDGDEAGKKATLRAVEMLERQDLEIGIVELPEGKDPADIVRGEGPDSMTRRVMDAVECFPYLLAESFRRFDRSGPAGKEGIRDFFFPFIAALGSQVRADDYIRRLAEAIGAGEAAVRADFMGWKKSPRQPREGRRAPERGTAMSPDLFLMMAVAAHQELFPMVRNGNIGLADLEDERAKEIFVAMEESFRADEKSFDALLLRIADEGLKETLISKVSSGEFDLNQEKIVGDVVKSIKRRAMKKKRDDLDAEMRRMERGTPDPARMRELLAEKMHLDGELERLRSASVEAPRIPAGRQDA
jgi:DNA primase